MKRCHSDASKRFYAEQHPKMNCCQCRARQVCRLFDDRTAVASFLIINKSKKFESKFQTTTALQFVSILRIFIHLFIFFKNCVLLDLFTYKWTKKKKKL